MSKEVCLARAVFGNSVLSFRMGDPAAIASSSVSVPSALALAMRDWRALMNASRRCEYDVDLVGTFDPNLVGAYTGKRKRSAKTHLYG